MSSFFLFGAIVCHLSSFWSNNVPSFFWGNNVPSFFLLGATMCYLSFGGNNVPSFLLGQ